MPPWSMLVLACIAWVGSPSGADAQEVKRLFAPLIADPKQPHFFATWLWVKSPIVTGTLASIGLGEDVGLAGGQGRGCCMRESSSAPRQRGGREGAG